MLVLASRLIFVQLVVKLVTMLHRGRHPDVDVDPTFAFESVSPDAFVDFNTKVVVSG